MEKNLTATDLTSAQDIRIAAWPRAAAGIVLFTALTALAAQIRIPLPFTPVPMTAQLVPVLLSGAILGASGGAWSQILLIVAGIAGAPVFAGGAFGPAHLLGPTGGYLIGFAWAAWLTGWLLHDRASLGHSRIFVSMLAASALVHVFGMLQLMVSLGGSASLAFQLGSLPFLPGDLLKALVAASLVAGWRARRRV